MTDVTEIWAALSEGKTVSDGEIEAWYESNMLHTHPEQPIVPFDSHNAENWYIVGDNEHEVQYYCRWYYVFQTGTVQINNDKFHLVTEEPTDGYKRENEAYTFEELKGAASAG